MSPGNLHYHFKTKHQIVEWLFRRFEDRLSAYSGAAEGVGALDDFWLTLHLAFEAIGEYRFIFRDIDFLLGEHPVLEARARAITDRSLHATKRLCVGLVEAGMIEATDEELDMLALQIVFTMTCWFSFARLTPKHDPRHGQPGLAAYYTLTLLSPYLIGEARDYLNYLRVKYLR